MRAQVTGEVRVSYPFLGMGVAFRNLNPENRQQLAAMIESLRPSLQRVVAQETMSSAAPVSLPIILNPGAALQALADHFERTCDAEQGRVCAPATAEVPPCIASSLSS